MGRGGNSLGTYGEDLAEDFLKKKGYRILQRNFEIKLGEIDIVAQHDGLRGAGILTEATENAPQQVDLIRTRIPLAWREAPPVDVFTRLDENGAGWTGSRTQCTADASLKPILVPC